MLKKAKPTAREEVVMMMLATTTLAESLNSSYFISTCDDADRRSSGGGKRRARRVNRIARRRRARMRAARSGSRERVAHISSIHRSAESSAKQKREKERVKASLHNGIGWISLKPNQRTQLAPFNLIKHHQKNQAIVRGPDSSTKNPDKHYKNIRNLLTTTNNTDISTSTIRPAWIPFYRRRGITIPKAMETTSPGSKLTTLQFKTTPVSTKNNVHTEADAVVFNPNLNRILSEPTSENCVLGTCGSTEKIPSSSRLSEAAHFKMGQQALVTESSSLNNHRDLIDSNYSSHNRHSHSSSPPDPTTAEELSECLIRSFSSSSLTPSIHRHHNNNTNKKNHHENTRPVSSTTPNYHPPRENVFSSPHHCDYTKMLARLFPTRGPLLGRCVPTRSCVKTFWGLLLILHLVGTSMLTSAVPVPKKKISTEVKGMNYLTNFGYVSGPSQEAENLMSESVKIESIKRFQMFADLPVTGIFDHRTMEMMEKPRCGNSDQPALNDWGTGRTKRYVLSESRWGRTNLTFRFLNYTPDINFPKIRKAIYDAFLVWSRVTHLTFTEIMFDSNNGKDADIRIQFAQRYHNDGYPFDGEGIILAHAFFPGENKGGDTHFDDDEHWTVDSDEGVNLFMVAAHEFGHALGLSHSKTPGSLMYPWYQGKQSKGYQLPQDDVDGIQTLYGVKNGNETLDILVREFTNDNNAATDDDMEVEIPHGNCTHTFDAITKIRGDVYIFKGKYFWRWTSGGLKDSKPIPISHFWYQFPEESIDAVFERKRDSKIMFFKGDKYWLYDANHMERGWPLKGRPLVELGLPGDLKKIDAAFTWGFNKRTYLVSNDMYWKFDEMESYMVYDYPRAMTIWHGVPTPLDAAFQFTDNKTYFIKGKYYWEYEDQKMRVKSRSPTGNIAERWMQCPSESRVKPNRHKEHRLQYKTESGGHRTTTSTTCLLFCIVAYLAQRLSA